MRTLSLLYISSYDIIFIWYIKRYVKNNKIRVILFISKSHLVKTRRLELRRTSLEIVFGESPQLLAFYSFNSAFIYNTWAILDFRTGNALSVWNAILPWLSFCLNQSPGEHERNIRPWMTWVQNFASVFGGEHERGVKELGVGERVRGWRRVRVHFGDGGRWKVTWPAARRRGDEGGKRWKSRDFYAIVRKCCQFRRNSRAIRTFAIRLSSLPRVIVVPCRSLFFCKPRFLCASLRVRFEPRHFFLSLFAPAVPVSRGCFWQVVQISKWHF